MLRCSWGTDLQHAELLFGDDIQISKKPLACSAAFRLPARWFQHLTCECALEVLLTGMGTILGDP